MQNSIIYVLLFCKLFFYFWCWDRRRRRRLIKHDDIIKTHLFILSKAYIVIIFVVIETTLNKV